MATPDLDELLLVFEELTSNGLRHGRPPVRVVLVKTPTGWLLDVSDAAAESPPVPARDRDPAAGGLGLGLVVVLSAAHGWTVDGQRKHVWAASTAAGRSGRSQVRFPDRAPPTDDSYWTRRARRATSSPVRPPRLPRGHRRASPTAPGRAA